MAKTLYWDLVGGAAGDMLLASLIDLGVDLEPIQSALDKLGLDEVQLESVEVKPAGLRARRIDVIIKGHLADTPDSAAHAHHHPHRPYKKVRQIIEQAKLPNNVRNLALKTFAHLAEAEADAHGIDIEEVEFHEVGADDAIADIVGVAAAITSLELDQIIVSAVPLGRGLITGAHGPIPLPAPATLFILKQVPTSQTSLEGELVTPTGAALIKALADHFGSIPSMVIEDIGLGAGRKEWPDRPNIVRALLGQTQEKVSIESEDELVIETNIDDMTPQQLANLEKELRSAGAIDVWRTSIGMKKNRTGQLVSALVRRSSVEAITQTFFTHSTTLGLREYEVKRHRAEREMLTVETIYGPVTVKLSKRPDGSKLCVPEFDDCVTLAKKNDTSVRMIQEAALNKYLEKK